MPSRGAVFSGVGILVLAFVLVVPRSTPAPTARVATETLPAGDAAATSRTALVAASWGEPFRATGRIAPIAEIVVGSEISGKVAEVRVEPGDVVEAGAVLALLDDREARALLDRARAGLREAQAEAARRDVERRRLASERARAALATAQAVVAKEIASLRAEEAAVARARLRVLHDRSVVPSERLDDAARTSRIAVAEEEAARLRLSAARESEAIAELAVEAAAAAVEAGRQAVAARAVEVALAEIGLERTRIRAPVSGVVLGRRIEPGLVLNAQTNVPELFVLAPDPSRLRVVAQVSEVDVTRIGPGVRATFTTAAAPDERIALGRLSASPYPTPDERSVVYEVSAEILAGAHRLLPGMTAVVEFEPSHDAALEVPSAALRTTGDGRHVVDVRRGAETVAQPVEIVGIVGDRAQVRAENLAAGDELRLPAPR
ncbi:HlyD family efflux transporter periplasmic adaptor subunit [Salinarimonas sp.]|uniref:efflux RND transporter periplasmic adaptor subunit n=1 Tax=Salinarimonas sp. TaxID=2766526 RepID=UPI0032D95AD5